MIAFLFLIMHFSFSGVCDSLSDLACAPGKFNDGTGTVPSESEVRRARSQLEESVRVNLSAEFSNLIKNPDNIFLKESAKQAFGLADFPACSSKTAQDKLECDQNIIEGLTNLGEKNILGTEIARLGDLESIEAIQQNHLFISAMEKATANPEKQLGTEPITKRIQNTVFPGVKNVLVTKINSWPLSPEQKQLMVSKVKSIRFDGSKCSDDRSSIQSLLIPNAYYNPRANTFSYCAGMASRSSSDFTLALIVAHELAHSIDPCRLGAGLKGIMGESEIEGSLQTLDGQSPYANLISCLRDEKSIGAANSAATRERERNREREYQFHDPNENKDPDPRPSTATFCENDQINESFCDWVGAEVLPEYIQTQHKLTQDQYINGYANAFKPICDTHSELRGVSSSHPRSQDRVDKIIVSNPKVRKNMGCPPEGKAIYCAFGGDTAPIKQEPMNTPFPPPGGRVEK